MSEALILALLVLLNQIENLFKSLIRLTTPRTSSLDENLGFVDPRGIEPLIFSMPWRRRAGRPRARNFDVF